MWSFVRYYKSELVVEKMKKAGIKKPKRKLPKTSYQFKWWKKLFLEDPDELRERAAEDREAMK